MIRVDTLEYVLSHGHEPRGFGLWMFRVGQQTVAATGFYRAARNEAKRQFRLERGVKTATMVVCS